MSSYESAPTPQQNEIARHAIRYAVFILLTLFALWSIYNVWTSFKDQQVYLKDITTADDGYIVVDNGKWVQYDIPNNASAYYEPEGHPVLVYTDKGTTYEKLPNGMLYLNGKQVDWMDADHRVFLRAKEPNVKVRVKITARY